MDLLLGRKVQYRVYNVQQTDKYFQKWMKAGKMQRGFRIRFVPYLEESKIEIQSDNQLEIDMLVRVLSDAKLLKHKIPFKIHNVVKLKHGRRDGKDFS
jgi:hypothetical protein